MKRLDRLRFLRVTINHTLKMFAQKFIVRKTSIANEVFNL